MVTETVEVTCMSSRGQVVIPQGLRERLHLATGEKFVVFGSEDTIILKKLYAPSREEFEKLLKETRKAVKKSGIAPKDIQKAIKAVRARKKR